MNTKLAEYRYVYDPKHENKPSGLWNRTNSGWSSNSGDGLSNPVHKKPKTVEQNTDKDKIKSQENLFDKEKNNFDIEEDSLETVEEDAQLEENVEEPIEIEETEQETETEKNDFFTDEKKEEFLNKENFDDFIEKMNSFIDIFDKEQGQENKITFKAVASNLDWSIENDVKAFAEHCKKQNLLDAEQIIAFLYYQYNNDKEGFENILDKMN